MTKVRSGTESRTRGASGTHAGAAVSVRAHREPDGRAEWDAASVDIGRSAGGVPPGQAEEGRWTTDNASG
jgi:hypothetical protein